MFAERGGSGRGTEGSATITLAASPTSYAALVESWDSAPFTGAVSALRQPEGFATNPTIRPEAVVARPDQAMLQPLAPDPTPQAPTRPAPVPMRPAVLSDAPALAAPPDTPAPAQVTASAFPPELTAPTTAPDPRNSGAIDDRLNIPSPPPDLPALADPTALPEVDERPHFEGSTDLATEMSPRPTVRPEDLAPPSPPPAAASATPPSQSTPVPDQPDRPSDPAPATTAQGSGGGATQGGAPQPTPQPGLSQGQIQSLLSQWGGSINARIARARPNVNGTGRVIVRLSVAPSGALVGLGISRSSGNAAVDQAALSAVQRAGRFPRAPRGLTDPSYSFSLPITFQ